MKRVFGYLCLCGCAVSLLSPSVWAAGTISWEIVATGEAGAVDLTPHPPGTTEVTLAPGGIIKTEYYVEGWYPDFPGTTCGGVAGGTACLVAVPDCVGNPDGADCRWPMTCGGVHNGTPCTADAGNPDAACEAGTRCYPDKGPLLLAYQMAPDLTTFTNGAGSSLELATIPCNEGSDCNAFLFCPSDTCGSEPLGTPCTAAEQCVGHPAGETCGAVCGTCEDSVFVDETRFDWIYFQKSTFNGGNCNNLQLGATVVTDRSASDSGARVYLGTLVVQLSENACGDFVLALDQVLTTAEGDSPFVMDESATLTIHSTGVCAGGACCNIAAGTCDDGVLEEDCTDDWTAGTACADLNPPCVAPCWFESSDPPGCEEDPGAVGIDAGKPRDHDSLFAECNGVAGLCGWDSVDVTFNAACDTSVFLDSRKWLLEQLPAGGPVPPTVPLGQQPVPAGPQTVRVFLSGPINTTYWSCLSLRDDATQRICLGYLSGDVSGDGVADTDDILAAIDALTNAVPRPLYSVDVDRDGQGAAPDILEVVNVLNSAGFFPNPPDSQMEGWSDCPPQ